MKMTNVLCIAIHKYLETGQKNVQKLNLVYICIDW